MVTRNRRRVRQIRGCLTSFRVWGCRAELVMMHGHVDTASVRNGSDAQADGEGARASRPARRDGLAVVSLPRAALAPVSPKCAVSPSVPFKRSATLRRETTSASEDVWSPKKVRFVHRSLIVRSGRFPGGLILSRQSVVPEKLDVEADRQPPRTDEVLSPKLSSKVEVVQLDTGRGHRSQRDAR